MSLPLLLPAPPGYQDIPEWTGREFRIGKNTTRILSYEIGASGWTDELTALHEDADDEEHYINVASREHAVNCMQRWIIASAPVLIDIGCSSGYTVRLLRARMPNAAIIGADFVRGPLEGLGKTIPDLPLLHFDLLKCPLPASSFDGIILLNVLEHIENDMGAIQQVARILKPGGVATIEVPAGPGLYDIYDKQLMHVRRYRMTDLVAKIRATGLEVVERSHLACALYPAFWATKKWNQRYMNSSAEIQRKIVSRNMRQARHNPLMTLLMKAEARLRGRAYLPFGIRCLATCRKR